MNKSEFSISFQRIVEILFYLINALLLYAIVRNIIVNGLGVMYWLPNHQLLGIVGVIFSAPILILSGVALIYGFNRKKIGLLFIAIGVIWISVIIYEAYIKTY